MQKSQIDQGLAFKKRARRRLVGAIALVFLMIIILPMILEDREQSLSQDEIEITMPDHEVSDLDSPSLSELSEDTVETLSANDMADDTVAAEVINLPKKTVSQPATPKAKEIVEPTVEKPEVKKATKPEEAKKSVEPAVKSNKFYVQIGVFSDPENIKKLQVKLSDLGYKSLTEKMTTSKGVKTRLRTEAFEGRNEAAIALENIKDSGLTGMVVNQK